MSNHTYTAAVNFRQLARLLEKKGHPVLPDDSTILAIVAGEKGLSAWATRRMRADPTGFRQTLEFYMTE